MNGGHLPWITCWGSTAERVISMTFAPKEIPEKAIRMAVEANSDPSARNIRVAVVVADQKVADAIREVAALALPTSASAMKIFTNMDEAETWLARSSDKYRSLFLADTHTCTACWRKCVLAASARVVPAG